MKHRDTSPLQGLDPLDLLNGLPHGVALLDAEGRLVSANRPFEAITGYAAQEAQGIGCDFVIQSNPDIKKAIFESPSDSVAPLTFDGDIINVNRKKAMMRFFVSPLSRQSGQRVGYLVALEDITSQAGQQQSKGRNEGKGIVGISPRMQEILEFMPILARTDTTLLITGETGTGKDLLAEAIHQQSKRAAFPFIKVNCGALPETLLESELFGHVRGAFTGAHTDKPGMFRLAQGGTLFLTEIGDLPLSLQVKLLTVLDDREFFPLGSVKKVRVDVRLITGTNRDLRQMVKEGTFREDLFYRLNVLRAHLPPLRERGDDITLLLEHFIKQFAAQLGKEIAGFSPEATEILASYPYPGNVRELRNIAEYAVNLCPGGSITAAHLPANVRNRLTPQEELPTSSPANQTAAASRPAERSTDPASDELPGATWSEIERNRILQALVKTGGNRSLAARELGWGRSTLWRKIRRYQLE